MHSLMQLWPVVDRCDQSKDAVCNTRDPYQAPRSEDSLLCDILTALVTCHDTLISRSGDLVWRMTTDRLITLSLAHTRRVNIMLIAVVHGS